MVGFEVVRKDNPNARLTVTKQRVTLKLRSDFTPEFDQFLMDWSKEIAEELQPVADKTIRGAFKRSDGEVWIDMYDRVGQKLQHRYLKIYRKPFSN